MVSKLPQRLTLPWQTPSNSAFKRLNLILKRKQIRRTDRTRGKTIMKDYYCESAEMFCGPWNHLTFYRHVGQRIKTELSFFILLLNDWEMDLCFFFVVFTSQNAYKKQRRKKKHQCEGAFLNRVDKFGPTRYGSLSQHGQSLQYSLVIVTEASEPQKWYSEHLFTWPNILGPTSISEHSTPCDAWLIYKSIFTGWLSRADQIN